MYLSRLAEYMQNHKIPAIVTPFTKIEKMKTNKYKAPRMIQARHPVFNIHYGAYIKPLEHMILSRKTHIHFGKGDYDLIAQKINKLRNKYTWYTEGDHKTFDAHVTTEALKLTHKFYQSCYNHDRKLRELSKRTLNNICISRHEDKYKIKGTRMSGDVDTSIGNSLINYAILMWLLDELGITGDAIVNGDDFILFTKEEIPIDLAATMFRRVNMETELLPSTQNIHQVEFCKSKFVITPEGNFTMMANPSRSIETFGMTHRVHVDRQSFIHDVAICHAYINSNNPIGLAWAKKFNITIDKTKIPNLCDIDPKLKYALQIHISTNISSGEITESMYLSYPDLDYWLNKLNTIDIRKQYPNQAITVNHDTETLCLN